MWKDQNNILISGETCMLSGYEMYILNIYFLARYGGTPVIPAPWEAEAGTMVTPWEMLVLQLSRCDVQGRCKQQSRKMLANL